MHKSDHCLLSTSTPSPSSLSSYSHTRHHQPFPYPSLSPLPWHVGPGVDPTPFAHARMQAAGDSLNMCENSSKIRRKLFFPQSNCHIYGWSLIQFLIFSFTISLFLTPNDYNFISGYGFGLELEMKTLLWDGVIPPQSNSSLSGSRIRGCGKGGGSE
jgi:hypothetical protein